MPPCLTLSIIRYGSRVKWTNPGNGVAPSPTPWCSSYRKGSFRVTLDYGRQLYLLTYSIYIYIYIYIYKIHSIYIYIYKIHKYNSYAISHLVIIIIIIHPPRIYYTNIFTTQYNLTYTHCDSCPPYTFTNQILTHSPQLAVMIICPTVNERIYRNKCIHIRYPFLL